MRGSGVDGPVSEKVMEQPGRSGRVVGRWPMLPPVEGSLRHNLNSPRRTGEPLTEDQMNMRVRSDVAAMHLLKTIPWTG